MIWDMNPESWNPLHNQKYLLVFFCIFNLYYGIFDNL